MVTKLDILNVKRSRRGKLVIHLYYNQRNNVRQIAQEAGMSFRDLLLY